MNLIEQLEAENRHILLVLARLDDKVLRPTEHQCMRPGPGAEEPTARALALELQEQIRRHDALEEALFFPEVKRWAPEQEETLQALEREHRGIEDCLAGMVKRLPAETERAQPQALLELLELTNSIQRCILGDELDLYGLARASIPQERLASLRPQ